MKKSVYLDTTIPNYLFDQRESIKTYCEVTRRWWKTESSKYDIFISSETLAESEEGQYSHQKRTVKFLESLNRLEESTRVNEIAKIYVVHKLIPQKVSGDAMHLAYASFYKMDFLLTWNCNHLANANKKQHISIMNTRMNLPVPEIITPLELFSTED